MLISMIKEKNLVSFAIFVGLELQICRTVSFDDIQKELFDSLEGLKPSPIFIIVKSKDAWAIKRIVREKGYANVVHQRAKSKMIPKNVTAFNHCYNYSRKTNTSQRLAAHTAGEQLFTDRYFNNKLYTYVNGAIE